MLHELDHASGTAAALTRKEDLYFHLLLPSLIAEYTQHMLGNLHLVAGAIAAADGQLNKRPGKKGAPHWCEARPWPSAAWAAVLCGQLVGV